VADVVDAMSSHRPYRPAVGLEAAIQTLNADRGQLFDAAVVDACLRVIHGGYFDRPHATAEREQAELFSATPMAEPV
jgi:HD-GYP domain-containing protein (c-di-GMP phosphodiesterase class II)